MISNYGKSVRARLLNLAKKEHMEFMKVLVRYLHERLLYRVSTSKYNSQFLLKGSSLLYAYDQFKARPTIDIDLLGNKISGNQDDLKNVFAEICSIACEEDGVSFDVSTMQLAPIAVEKKYPGTCITITVYLDTIVQPISIDIGFGDVVTPAPLLLDYPLLLPDVPPVELYAYSLESLIAEKFHAMVDRDGGNSRMKDYFDVYYLFKNHKIDSESLQEAIADTFRNRGMKYHEHLQLFTDEFAADSTRIKRWNAFLEKIGIKEQLPFSEVMNTLRDNLMPYWSRELLSE